MAQTVDAWRLLRNVHERRNDWVPSLVSLALHPDHPYAAYVEDRLDRLLEAGEPRDVDLLVACAAEAGSYALIHAVVRARADRDECDESAAVQALVADHVGTDYFALLHDIIALDHPDDAAKAFWDLVADGRMAQARRFEYRSPELRACQARLDTMSTAHRPEVAADDLQDLLNRLPPPPPCLSCEACSACEGCGGCYGCDGCGDCTGCRGCAECGQSSASPRVVSRTVDPDPSPCRARLVGLCGSLLGKGWSHGQSASMGAVIEAFSAVRCAAHPLTDLRVEVEQLLSELQLELRDKALHPGERTPALVAGLLQEGRPFDFAVIPPEVTLRPWQAEALSAWAAHGRRGIIEAVTGAGKTLLGTAAVLEATAEGRLAVVVVPLIVLQEQWEQVLQPLLTARGVPLHLMGNKHRAVPTSGVLVAVVNSLAASTAFTSAAAGSEALIVADECHNYGSAGRARALSDLYGPRLGLTATLDGAPVSKYFSGTAFELDHSRALRERAISRYDALIVRTPLNSDEVASYDDAHHRIKFAERDLLRQVPHLRRLKTRFGPMSSAIRQLAGNPSHPAAGDASRWVEAVEQRSIVLSRSQGKASGLSAVVPAIRASAGTLVFTMMREPARAAAELLAQRSLRVQCIDGASEQSFRVHVLDRLRAGELDAVVAPRILDEGINVPRVDTAVVVASSKLRRQMIQRLGRIVRAKPDPSATALLVVLAARNTVEDPFCAEREQSFLHEILANAARVAIHDVEDESGIRAFISSR